MKRGGATQLHMLRNKTAFLLRDYFCHIKNSDVLHQTAVLLLGANQRPLNQLWATFIPVCHWND